MDRHEQNTVRIAYAQKQIDRLYRKIIKLEGINAALKPGASGPDFAESMNASIIIANNKQIASSKAAIKRWQATIEECRL